MVGQDPNFFWDKGTFLGLPDKKSSCGNCENEEWARNKKRVFNQEREWARNKRFCMLSTFFVPRRHLLPVIGVCHEVDFNSGLSHSLIPLKCSLKLKFNYATNVFCLEKTHGTLMIAVESSCLTVAVSGSMKPRQSVHPRTP